MSEKIFMSECPHCGSRNISNMSKEDSLDPRCCDCWERIERSDLEKKVIYPPNKA
jgi:hypothetical protein